MSVIFVIILVLAASCISALLGYMGRVALEKAPSYDGVIRVETSEDRTLYSLELHADPEQLQFMEQVVFAVKNSEE